MIGIVHQEPGVACTAIKPTLCSESSPKQQLLCQGSRVTSLLIASKSVRVLRARWLARADRWIMRRSLVDELRQTQFMVHTLSLPTYRGSCLIQKLEIISADILVHRPDGQSQFNMQCFYYATRYKHGQPNARPRENLTKWYITTDAPPLNKEFR